MKKSLLVTSAIAAGTVALYYLVKKMRAGKQAPQIPGERSRHRTGLFAKAKHVDE